MKKLVFNFSLLCFVTCFSQDSTKMFTVYFENNSHQVELNSRNLKILDSIVQINNEYEIFASLFGYADEVGSKEDNYKLSLQRANAVKDYLFRRGVKHFKVLEGKGEISNSIQNKKSKNRRVDIIVNKESDLHEGKIIVIKGLFEDLTKPTLDHFLQYFSQKEFDDITKFLIQNNSIVFEINTFYSLPINSKVKENYNLDSGKYDFAETKGINLKNYFISKGISKNRIKLKTNKSKKGHGLEYGSHVELVILKI